MQDALYFNRQIDIHADRQTNRQTDGRTNGEEYNTQYIVRLMTVQIKMKTRIKDAPPAQSHFITD